MGLSGGAATTDQKKVEQIDRRAQRALGGQFLDDGVVHETSEDKQTSKLASLSRPCRLCVRTVASWTHSHSGRLNVN
jgi:hypothetical protein